MKKIGPASIEIKNLDDFKNLVPENLAVILISDGSNQELKNNFDIAAKEFEDV